MTRPSRRRRHHLAASVPVPTPKLRYSKRTSIAWLLLRHRFLATYSDQVTPPDLIPSALCSTPHQHNLDTIYILQFIDTISNNIDRELSDFHRPHHSLSTTFCSSNPDNNETITTLDRHLVSVSKVLLGELHNLQITDLLLDDGIARLEYALSGNDDYDVDFTLANTITPSDLSGQFAHPYHMPSPPSSTTTLFLRGGLAIDNPDNSPWTFIPLSPPSSPPDPSHDDFHGCTPSHPDDDHPPNQPSQPHKSVCDITIHKQKNTPHTMTTIYTQNARGLWRRPHDLNGDIIVDAPPDLTKLENIIDYMRQHDVGSWLLQETWEEGDNFDTEIGGYHIFRHNADQGTTGRQHLFRRVAIIFSPQFHDAWKLAGSPSPVIIDPADNFPGRFLRLNLKFDSFDKWGKKIRGRSLAIALISTYFPCDDQHHDRFCTILDSMLNSINVNTTIIIGGDINARIGTRTCEEHMQVLGPHGIPRSNA
jgi:hypothetical protein